MKKWKELTAAVLAGVLAAAPFAGTVFAQQAGEELPLYVEAGIWEEDFVRANDNLNGLAWDINDETLAKLKKEEATNKGTVVPIEYDTYFYALDAANGDVLSHESPLTKQAFVYLPYGYDENKQYNVLYLYHGGSDDEYMWFKQTDSLDYADIDNSEVGKGYAVNILDNMFEQGLADPCIVVTPSLYAVHNYERTEDNDYPVDMESDYLFETLTYDLRDLIPVVESTYSTYAEDVTEEGLIASRDHRAMAGLSMGSHHTWKSGLNESLDIISWFGILSGGPFVPYNSVTKEKYTPENKGDYIDDCIENKTIPAIEEAAANGWKLNMLLNFDGLKDMTMPLHVYTHQKMLEYAQNSDLLNVGENYDFVVSNGRHMFSAWNLYLYDMLQVFFK